MNWFQVQIGVRGEQREWLIDRLFELGAQGVEELDEQVKAYFEASALVSLREELQEVVGALSLELPEIESVEEKNWAEVHKDFFRPHRLTDQFFMVPAWETDLRSHHEQMDLILEPGQAFGTGLHASTQLSLGLLEWAVDVDSGAVESLIDVGTGSGILSIAARMLGVPRVVGIDLDPVAVDEAVKNAKLNGCDDIDFSDRALERVGGSFDVVVSNILLLTHLDLGEHYARLVAPGGKLILAGLVGEQRTQIVDALKSWGFCVEVATVCQEWLALCCRRMRNV